MDSTTVLITCAGAVITAGLLVVIAALAGLDLLPAQTRWAQRPTGRPRRRPAEYGLAVAAGAAAWVITGWPVAGAAIALAVLWVPRMLAGRAARGRIARLEALESWARQLADVLTTGHGIEDALLASAEDPPAPITAEVAALRRRLEFHIPTEDALRAFADEVNHPVGDTMTAALIITSRRGGRGLHDVLTALADTMAKDVAMQREIDAERATHRTTAIWVLAALALYTGFALLNRTYVAPFATATGQGMLALVTLLYAGTLAWLHRLATPPPGHRFLPPAGRSGR